MPTFKTIRRLATVSRPEFLPANSASLILGISWSIDPPFDLAWGLAIPAALVFAIITLVSAFAAQVNTMSDYEFDLKDSRKEELVRAMSSLRRGTLKAVMIVELLLSFVLVLVLLLIQGNPALLFLWAVAVFLAYSYSAPPLRLKSRAWLAMATLLLVLSFLPILFVFYSFSFVVEYFFLLFLSGQALVVYGVIVPAEIRDYFVDKAMGIETLTVRLGLVKASVLGIVLLGIGGVLCGTGFLLRLSYGFHPVLTVSLVVMAVAHGFVLKKYLRLYSLSKEYISSKGQSSAEKIIELSAHNPQWITLITQTIVFTSLVLLASKFLV